MDRLGKPLGKDKKISKEMCNSSKWGQLSRSPQSVPPSGARSPSTRWLPDQQFSFNIICFPSTHLVVDAIRLIGRNGGRPLGEPFEQLNHQLGGLECGGRVSRVFDFLEQRKEGLAEAAADLQNKGEKI